MTIRDRTVDETMPSIMGTAIRCMTSEPVPVLQRIGNGPRHDRDDRHHLRTHTPHRVQHNRLMKIRVALGHTAKFEKFLNGGSILGANYCFLNYTQIAEKCTQRYATDRRTKRIGCRW